MAQRRMFSKEVTTSDLFVDMPSSSQLLYFHLGMEADDEGFIGNAKMLSRAYGSNNDDLKLLEAKGFIIAFPSGVTVVKDWNLNNKIRKDRQKPTIYTEEKTLLSLDSKGSYLLGNQVSTIPQPNDNQMSAQDRIGEVRLGKDSIGKVSIDASQPN
ncbi:MAG: replisome organizer, partial [Lactococcus lactis]|nr:replisome organizer [Lactococcus lactis]